MSRVVKTYSVCDEYIAAVKAVEEQAILGNLTCLKAYKEGCLVFISDTLELLTRCESAFTVRITSPLNSAMCTPVVGAARSNDHAGERFAGFALEYGILNADFEMWIVYRTSQEH